MRDKRKNLTRVSPSIPRKLLREGAAHLVPLYYLLTLSDLASEGIHHSGSYLFADHIYAGIPSGCTPLGRWLDARLLSMPASRAFRRRYLNAQAAVRTALETMPGSDVLRVLAVPCGIPRDMWELSRTLQQEHPELLRRLEYHGMDLDPSVLDVARTFLHAAPLRAVHFHRGDALAASDYPTLGFHAVVSTGLAEFLDDAELSGFFAQVYRILEPGGMFYTSATAKDRRSDALMHMVELLPHYRTREQVARLLDALPWSRVDLARDSTGLQTFVTAVK